MKVRIALLKWSNERTMRDYTEVLGVFDESMFWKAEEIQREVLNGDVLTDFPIDDYVDLTSIDVELVDFEVQSEK